MDRSERIGLGVATAGHVLLFGALSLGLLRTSVPLPPRQTTIDVALADSIALESRTTQPTTEAPRSATAPEQGPPEPDAAAPEPSEAISAPMAAPAPPTPAPPKPRAVQPTPEKARETQRKQTPKASTKSAEKKPAAKAEPTPKPSDKPQRASRLGRDFLKGLDADTPSARNAPTSGSNAPMGAVAARALNAEINRQIKPFWRPPSGADAEKLVTLLSVHLDQNGAVVGRIEVVGQEGITASNRAQADLHAERAVQAVTRASPFRNLPPEYYDQWKWLRPLRFDARMSQ